MKNLEKHKYTALLIGLFCMYFVSPFFAQNGETNDVSEVIFAAVLIFSIWLISHRKTKVFIGVILAAPLLLLDFLFVYVENTSLLHFLTLTFGVLFFIFMIVVLSEEMLRAKRIDIGIIHGAISVYMLIGIMWGFVFSLVESASPGSFPNVAADNHNIINDFIYFSVVTLTTLGYGDIAPLTPVAKSFASMEALIGQVYLTVLVGRIVGMYLAQSREK